MADIKEEPYARWLEGVLQEIVSQHPTSIALLTMQEDGTIGSAYYGADNAVRALFVRTIQEDNLMQFLAVNASYIRDLLDDEEEDEE